MFINISADFDNIKLILMAKNIILVYNISIINTTTYFSYYS